MTNKNEGLRFAYSAPLALAAEHKIDLSFYDYEVDVIWWTKERVNPRQIHTEYYKNHLTKLDAVECAIKKAIEFIKDEAND